MTALIPETFLVESVPSSSDEEQNTVIWDVIERGYYDLTPPSEVSELDDLYPNEPPNSKSVIEPLVAVIGVGYVGEHLVNVFSQRFDVLGYDISTARVKRLSESFEGNSRVQMTAKASDISKASHFLISVPTLLLPDKTIDSSYLRSALAAVGTHAQEGSIVVIESSVAVGMTRQLLGPLAKEKNYLAGMSPERVDPGRVYPPAQAIPKIVSGMDDIVPRSLEAITQLYSEVFDQVIAVSKPEVAEMMKLYENCQRMVCVAYANEMADACVPHGIDPFEVCSAAATKPFGYMPYTPGLGVGGHCIPVNPYYLLSNNQFPLLQKASESMRCRPSHIAHQIVRSLSNRLRAGPTLPGVLVVGIGFKTGQSHLANSPGVELTKTLVLMEKVEVMWIDPLVKQEALPQIRSLPREEWTVEGLQQRFEMVIVAHRPRELDFGILKLLKGVKVEMWCP